MSKFKIGDKVKYYESFKGLTRYGIVVPYPNPTMKHHTDPKNVWAYWVDDVSLICSSGKGTPTYMREETLELITPTTFEVGKKYRYREHPWFEVLFVTKTNAFVRNENGSEYPIKIRDFYIYKEYISPPPEEWRIVYKVCGDVIVGKIPFTSDSNARASTFWTREAYKTIRIDE